MACETAFYCSKDKKSNGGTGVKIMRMAFVVNKREDYHAKTIPRTQKVLLLPPPFLPTHLKYHVP